MFPPCVSITPWVPPYHHVYLRGIPPIVRRYQTTRKDPSVAVSTLVSSILADFAADPYARLPLLYNPAYSSLVSAGLAPSPTTVLTTNNILPPDGPHPADPDGGVPDPAKNSAP